MLKFNSIILIFHNYKLIRLIFLTFGMLTSFMLLTRYAEMKSRNQTNVNNFGNSQSITGSNPFKHFPSLLLDTKSILENKINSIFINKKSLPQVNGKIAFVNFPGSQIGNHQILTINADGTNQTNISNNTFTNTNPVWSPDGSKIVFESYRNSNYDIYVMNADGSNQTRLTTASASDKDPSWSPDGTKIVFVSQRSGYSEIYVMNTDGSGQTNLTNNLGDDYGPEYSPDGSKIVFGSNSSGRGIYTMNTNGTNRVRIVISPFLIDDYNPAWSPDGSKIAFERKINGFSEIYLINNDGSNQTRIKEGSNYHPAWAPDGTKIIFDSYINNKRDIYTMNTDGSGVVRLTSSAGENLNPSWQPLVQNCAFSINPTNNSVGATASNGSVAVTTIAPCGWSATSNSSWLNITGGGSGSAGNGTVSYSVQANTGPQRTGTLTIAGKTFTVNQASGCIFSINPTSQDFTSAGGNGSFALTASGADCGWTATNSAGWITITSSTSGYGNAVINFTVNSNNAAQRSGTISVGGQTFTVNQSEVCSYSINPNFRSVFAEGGIGTVNVTSASNCNWTAVSNVYWITVTNGSSGSGNGAVGYSIAANTGGARTGTITIGGKIFTVSQSSAGQPTVGIWTRSNVPVDLYSDASIAQLGLHTMVATANKVFLSTDNASSWRDVTPVGYRSNSSPSITAFGGVNTPLHFYIEGVNVIWLTSNGGDSWSQFNTPYSDSFIDFEIKAQSINGVESLLYAGRGPQSQNGIFYTSNGGVNWSIINQGLPAQPVCSNFASTSTTFASGQYVFVKCNGKFYRSSGVNTGWELMGTNGIPSNVAVLDISPAIDGSSRLYATVENNVCPIYRNDSNGDGIWTQACNNVNGLWNDNSYTNAPVKSIVSDLFDSNIAYANTRNTVYKTNDGGQLWLPFGMGFENDGKQLKSLLINNNGPINPRPTIHAFDGSNYSKVYTLNDVPNSGCSFDISLSSPVTIAGISVDHPVTVTTTTGCEWSIISNSSWISILNNSHPSNFGTFTRKFNVQSNETVSTRTGEIKIAGQAIAINQTRINADCFKPPITIGFGQTVTGMISSFDCATSEFFYDSYIFNGTVGQQIAISLDEMMNFNPYLDLLNPNGEIIASYHGNGARIPETGYFTLPTTGVFTIRAGTFPIYDTTVQTGNYILNLSLNGGTSINNTPFDFDGDGKADISIFRPSVGEWWYLRSSDGGNRAFQFGQNTDKIVPADFTGDGKTDVAFFRPSLGEWFILRSEDSSFYAFPFGADGDIPAPADYDGDGKADPAVFRPSSKTWYILNSSGGTTIQQFGAAEDIPMIEDYDGDGKADVAVFRPSVSEWWIKQSSSSSVKAFQFGVPGDKPAPADYTGDGKADVAFFRPSIGNWFILRSEDSSFFAFPFGVNGDIPVPGDYDGDGKADPAIFRPLNRTWYLLRSSIGFTAISFGANGDKPIPSAYIP